MFDAGIISARRCAGRGSVRSRAERMSTPHTPRCMAGALKMVERSDCSCRTAAESARSVPGAEGEVWDAHAVLATAAVMHRARSVVIANDQRSASTSAFTMSSRSVVSILAKPEAPVTAANAPLPARGECDPVPPCLRRQCDRHFRFCVRLAPLSANAVARAPVTVESRLAIFSASTSFGAGATWRHFSICLPSLSFFALFSNRNLSAPLVISSRTVLNERAWNRSFSRYCDGVLLQLVERSPNSMVKTVGSRFVLGVDAAFGRGFLPMEQGRVRRARCRWRAVRPACRDRIP